MPWPSVASLNQTIYCIRKRIEKWNNNENGNIGGVDDDGNSEENEKLEKKKLRNSEIISNWKWIVNAIFVQQFDLLEIEKKELKFLVWMADKLSRENCVHTASDAIPFLCYSATAIKSAVCVCSAYARTPEWCSQAARSIGKWQWA